MERKIREYNKTGKFNLASQKLSEETSMALTSVAGKAAATSAQSGGQTLMSPPSIRTSKLQRSNYFLEPRSMMNGIHRKTHFKAAISVARGDRCCVKVDPNEFSD